MKIKTIFSDISFRTLATIISTGVQQLVVLPILAAIFSPEMYGTILTVRGIYNTTTLGFGNALKSTRQIRNTDYNQNKLSGDFNILAWLSSIISVIVCTFVFAGLDNVGALELSILIPSVLITTLNSYYVVHYFLVINYKGLLINSIVTASGAVLGVALVWFTKLWPLPNLLAGIFNFCFLFKYTGRIKEPYRITSLFRKTTGVYVILIFTTLIAQGLTYLDRLFLFPIIGGSAVAIYSTAAFFGKGIAVIISPISSVLLSYYCQDDFKMTLKYFWTSNFIVLALAFIFILIAIPFAPIVTKLLYPSLADAAGPFIFLASLAAVIGISGNIIQSAVLKFANIRWQIVIELAYVMLYIFVGLTVLPKYGLMGFCYMVLLANTVRMVSLSVIGHFSIKRRNKQ